MPNYRQGDVPSKRRRTQNNQQEKIASKRGDELEVHYARTGDLSQCTVCTGISPQYRVNERAKINRKISSRLESYVDDARYEPRLWPKSKRKGRPRLKTRGTLPTTSEPKVSTKEDTLGGNGKNAQHAGLTNALTRRILSIQIVLTLCAMMILHFLLLIYLMVPKYYQAYLTSQSP